MHRQSKVMQRKLQVRLTGFTPQKGNGVNLSFSVDKEVIQNLSNAYVGHVSKPGDTYVVQKKFHMEGYFNIKATPLGANLVLLEPNDGVDVAKVVEEAKGWVEDWFDEIKAWSPMEIDKERLVWVKCFGIPYHAWSDNFFNMLASCYGVFMYADSCTSNQVCMDVARFLIRTKVQESISTSVKVHINGDLYVIIIIEEAPGEPVNCLSCNLVRSREQMGSSDGDSASDDLVSPEGSLAADQSAGGQDFLNFENALNSSLNVINAERISEVNGVNQGENQGEDLMQHVPDSLHDNVRVCKNSVQSFPCAQISNAVVEFNSAGVQDSLGQAQNQQLSQDNQALLSATQAAYNYDGLAQSLSNQNALHDPIMILHGSGAGLLVCGNSSGTKTIFPKGVNVHRGSTIQKSHCVEANVPNGNAASCKGKEVMEFPLSSHHDNSKKNASHLKNGETLQRNGFAKESSLSGDSISDSDIRFCNMKILLTDGSSVAEKVWKMAKEIGVSGSAPDDCYVKLLKDMEGRDIAAKAVRGLRTSHP